MTKRAKSSVDYGNGMPRAHCGICRHFEAPASCELVRGEIRPGGWCKLFEKVGKK